MSPQLAVRIPKEQLAALDQAVARGRFPSRAAAVRAGVERLLREESEREIAEAYRRGYTKAPQEEWTGEAGLASFAAFAAAEERGTEPL